MMDILPGCDQSSFTVHLKLAMVFFDTAYRYSKLNLFVDLASLLV